LKIARGARCGKAAGPSPDDHYVMFFTLHLS